MHRPLAGLDLFGVDSASFRPQVPEQHGRGGALDEAVEAETDQGDAPRASSGPQRHARLDDVIGEGGADQPEGDAPPVASGHGGGGSRLGLDLGKWVHCPQVVVTVDAQRINFETDTWIAVKEA